MRSLALSLALLAAGCGGHANVQIASSGTPATGTSSGGSVSINSSPRSAIGALIVIGTLVGIAHGSERTMPAPQLDESRRVLEQDCTRPIEDWSLNLKCR